MTLVLYTCPGRGNDVPGPITLHPCAKAIKALDAAGHAYELRTVEGFKALPWTRRGKRDEIRRLTGQEDVPVLVLEDGTAIHGSGAIARWAKDAAATAAT